VIKSFKHKGLQEFFENGSKAGIQPKHAARLEEQLFALNRATKPKDMNFHGWVLHPLQGALKGRWAVRVSGNWRLTFRFMGTNVEIVDYQDYH
jgi:toxin HigB-1